MARKKRRDNPAQDPQITASDSTPPLLDSPDTGPGTEKRLEIYRDERKLLMASEEAYAERFDKWIVSLAGGALGVSMAFVKDLVAPRNPIVPMCLFVAWVGFALCIGISLACALVCQRAREKFADALDDAFSRPVSDPLHVAAKKQRDRWEPTCIAWLNRLNIAVFVGAAVTLGYFVYCNLEP